MASFTDAISTFNPYVSQLPVDAMVKVGMYKQQKYDEGVQKIQGYIDNIAGLDVAKGPQKEYLQSKLNELGNNLKGVAAGDFSNQQVVNSVGGMATQLIKDPIIRNAVNSTQLLRKGQEELEDARKAGKSDKNNEDKFTYDANQWLNDGRLDSSFRGTYTPYTDITKLVKEGLTGAGLDASIAEQMFITEPGSNKPRMFYETVKNPKTGKDERVAVGYKYADVKTIEKISSNKEAVYAVLDNVMNRGDVKEQLRIDGWATYRNTDPDLLLEPLKREHEETDNEYNSKSLELGALLKATNISDKQRAALEDSSKQLELSKLNSEKQFADLYELSQKNPEAFKEYFYEQRFKNNLKKQFIKEESSLTFEANAGKAQENWQQTFDFNAAKEKSDIDFKNEDLKLKKNDAALKLLQFNADYEQDPVTGNYVKKDTKKKSIDPNDILQFSGNAPGDKLSGIESITSVQQDIDDLSAAKRNTAFGIYSNFVNQIRNGKGQPTLTDDEIEKQIRYVVAVGKKKDPSLDEDKYLDRWVSDISNKYVQNGLDLTPTLKDERDNYFSLSKQLTNKITLDKAAQENAKNKVGISLSESLKPITVTVADKSGLGAGLYSYGRTKTVTVTPEDQLLYYKVAGDRKDPTHPLFGKDVATQNKLLAESQDKLVSKFGDDYVSVIAQATGPGLSKIPMLGGKIHGDYLKEYNNELRKVTGATDFTGGVLPSGTPDEIRASTGALFAYLNSAEGLRSVEGGTVEELKVALANDPGGLTWRAKKPTTTREDWEGEVSVTDKKTGKDYVIKNINRTELEKITDLTFKQFEASPIKNIIALNKTKTTNVNYSSSPNAWKTAYFKENEADPAITKAGYTFRADVAEAPGGYRMISYIKAPKQSNFVTIYGEAIAPNEYILDQTFKTMTPAIVQSTYNSYLQNKNKK